MYRSILWMLALCVALSTPAQGQSASPAAPTGANTFKPTVVVVSTLADAQLSSTLRDALTQALIDSGHFEVVDRAHLQQVLREQGVSSAGQVLAGTEAQLGRMLGANYMLLAKLTRLDSVMDTRGFSLNMYPKVYLKSNVQVLEVRSARIVQSIEDEQTLDGPGVAATNENRAMANQFASRYLQLLTPKIVAQTATAVVAKLDLSKLGDSDAALHGTAHLQGRVMDVGPSHILISLGEGSGVAKGMTLGVYTAKQVRNPDSGKMISTYIQSGVIVVTQVDKEYSVAKKVSGAVSNGQVVRSEQ